VAINNNQNSEVYQIMPCGKKRKRAKMRKHKQKKLRDKMRHRKK